MYCLMRFIFGFILSSGKTCLMRVDVEPGMGENREQGNSYINRVACVALVMYTQCECIRKIHGENASGFFNTCLLVVPSRCARYAFFVFFLTFKPTIFITNHRKIVSLFELYFLFDFKLASNYTQKFNFNYLFLKIFQILNFLHRIPNIPDNLHNFLLWIFLFILCFEFGQNAL